MILTNLSVQWFFQTKVYNSIIYIPLYIFMHSRYYSTNKAANFYITILINLKFKGQNKSANIPYNFDSKQHQ